MWPESSPVNTKFVEKIYNNSRDIEFYLGDYFFGPPCIYCCALNALMLLVGWQKGHPTNKTPASKTSENIVMTINVSGRGT